jgi:hypothetical protein
MPYSQPAMFSDRFKVGLSTLAVIGVLLALTPAQHSRTPVFGDNYRLVFHEVQGLTKGNPVVVGGAEAGRVVDINFAPRRDWVELNKGQGDRPVVLVTVGMNPGFHLQSLSGYKILTTLKGPPTVNIIPGSNGQTLTSGTIINDEFASAQVDRLSDTIANIEDLVKSTRDVRNQFMDPKFQRSLKDSASNFRFYTRELMVRGAHAREQIDSVNQQLDEQQKSLLDAMTRADGKMLAMRAQMESGIIGKMKTGAHAMNANIVAMDQQLDGIITKASRYANMFHGYVRNLDHASFGGVSVKNLAAQAHSMADRLDEYAALAGDLHSVTSDPQVQRDLRDKLKQVKAKSETLKQAADTLEGISQGVRFLRQDTAPSNR